MARNKKHWEIHPSKLRKSKKILFPSHFPHTLGGVEYRRYLKQIRKQYWQVIKILGNVQKYLEIGKL